MTKFGLLSEAYSVIVQIVEEMRRECVSLDVDDSFKSRFNFF